MKKSAKDSENQDMHPENIVEDALWKLGVEKPECRQIVADLVSILRKHHASCKN